MLRKMRFYKCKFLIEKSVIIMIQYIKGNNSTINSQFEECIKNIIVNEWTALSFKLVTQTQNTKIHSVV